MSEVDPLLNIKVPRAFAVVSVSDKTLTEFNDLISVFAAEKNTAIENLLRDGVEGISFQLRLTPKTFFYVQTFESPDQISVIAYSNDPLDIWSGDWKLLLERLSVRLGNNCVVVKIEPRSS